jgi:DNA-binding MarR family transcriptional regulator
MSATKQKNAQLDILPYILHNIVTLIERQLGHELEYRGGLTLSELRVAEVVDWHPLCQQRFVASHLDQTEASISRLVAQLVERNIINRQADRRDKRRYGLTLTDTGRDKLRQARKIRRNCMAELFSSYGAPDTAAALALLANLESYLKLHKDETHAK